MIIVHSLYTGMKSVPDSNRFHNQASPSMLTDPYLVDEMSDWMDSNHRSLASDASVIPTSLQPDDVRSDLDPTQIHTLADDLLSRQSLLPVGCPLQYDR